jgi:hypothetical protein
MIRVVGWGGGAYTGNPLISVTPSKISHRTRNESVQYCSRNLALLGVDKRRGPTPSSRILLP